MKCFSSVSYSGILTASLCLLASVSRSQNVPVTPTASTLSAYTPPSTYANPRTVNYVRSWTARAPMTAPALTDLSNHLKYGEATAYVDGLGRPLQEVARAGSPDGTKDIVQVHVYDGFGREAQQFLPYPVTPSATYEGRYNVDPFTSQAAYYNTNFSDKRPYSEIDFEASPLNRPVAAFAPGNSWMGSKSTANPPVTTNEKATRSSYEISSASEVILWNIGNSGGDIPIKDNDPNHVDRPYYKPGELYRNVVTDEHNNRIIEYKDKEGRVILKKVELPASTTAPITPSTITSHTGWLCTYYVYDDFGLLRFVIPPKAVELLASPTNNWVFPTTAGGGDIGNELCFRYEYDSRNRLVVKKVPGAGEAWMVYDKRDRLAMTQDANQRNLGKWMVMQYDELNRPASTYLWNNTDSRVTHAGNAGATGTAVDYPTLTGTYELLTETFYDDYSWVHQSDPAMNGLSRYFVSGQYNTTDFITPDNTTAPYPQAVAPDYNVKGMSTGSRVKVLGTANAYLYTIVFYDDQGRVIQTQYRNYAGGVDIITNQYSFDGRLLVSKQKQQPSQSDNAMYVISRMIYNPNGLLLKTTKQLTDKWGTQHTQVTIAENSYDDLGKLITKKLGQKKGAPPITYTDDPAYTNQPVETLDYTYNVRGWLNSINRAYAHPDGYSSIEVAAQADRWFGMELSYDQGFSKAQYNGNISGTIWHSRGDDKKRAYGFDYDAANRLMKADFTQYAAANSWNTTAGIDYSMHMGNGTGDPYAAYDANGNIKQMVQMGYLPGSSSNTTLTSKVIDNLTYTYFANTNKLQQVNDAANDYQSHLGDFKYNAAGKTTTDYGYDANGNLAFDKNKQIAAASGGSSADALGSATGGMITYNYLNLPQYIDFGTKGNITYVYDAAGKKLTKTVQDNTGSAPKTILTIYNGNFVYEQPTANDPITLQYIGHEEGRIRLVSKSHVEEVDRYCPPPPVYPGTGDGEGGGPTGSYNCLPILTFNSYDEYEFDYFIKDHLGNTRAVLTDEVDQNVYVAATLEDGVVPSEQPYYDINTANIVDRQTYNIPDYPNNNGFINPNPQGTNSATSEKVYRLNGSSPSTKKGLDLVLRVMSGDHIDILGKSYHNSSGNPQQGATIPVLDLIAGLLGSPGSAASATHASASAIENMNSATTGYISMLQGQQDNGNSGLPRAGINWLLFNDRFECVGYGTSSVGAGGSVQNHYLQDIAVDRNGYLYVYCSNESLVDVFFDNLQVVHTRGPLLEESHYYPFGLTMAGISSKAAGKTESNKKFQGQEFAHGEFSDGSGLEMYEFKYRMDDPQTGRFWQIDPLADKYVYNSTYAFSENKVTGHVELEGLEAVPTEDKRPYPARVSTSSPINTFSPLISIATKLVKNDNVRVAYANESKTLGPGDKQARTDLKEKYRVQTPEPFKTIVENGRPMSGEQAKVNDPSFKGNAAKTNAEVTETVATGGFLGKVFLVVGIAQSTYTIATSDTPVKEVATEASGWAGAMYGGGQATAYGLSVSGGNPYVGFGFGILGSVAGFVAGKKGSDAVIGAAPAVIEGAGSFNNEKGIIYHIPH